MKFRVFIFYAAAFLAIAAIVSIAIIYSGSVGRSDPGGPLANDFVAARVDGVEIKGELINRELDASRAEVPQDPVDLKKLQQDVLQILIQLQILKNEAAERNIEITDQQLRDRINLYFSQGQQTLESFLSENNMTEEEFRNKLREEMLIEQLGIQIREELINKLAIADEEIKTYYEENLQRYDVSEVAHIYIRINPPGQDEQIKEAQERAKAVIARLNNGARFASVALQYSDDSSTKNSGGKLGPLNSGLLSNQLITVVSQLEADQITSEPIQVQDGFHIIKRLNEKYQPIEEVADSIRQTLIQRRVETEFEKWISDLRTQADVQIYL